MDPQKLSQGDKGALLADAVLTAGDLVLLSQVAQQNIFHKWEDTNEIMIGLFALVYLACGCLLGPLSKNLDFP